MGERTYRVKKAEKQCTLGEETFQGSMPSYCIIFPELTDVSEVLSYVQEESLKTSGMKPEWIRRITSLRYRIGLDMEGKEEDCKEVRKVIKERIGSEFGTFDTEHGIITESKEDSKASFFEFIRSIVLYRYLSGGTVPYGNRIDHLLQTDIRRV